MLTVFAVIGVLFTIAFIVYSIDNSKNIQNRNYQRNISPITKDSPQVKFCAFIISIGATAIQNDKELKYLTGFQRRNRINYILSQCHIGALMQQNQLAIQFDLPVSSIPLHLNWSFQQLRKEYLLK